MYYTGLIPLDKGMELDINGEKKIVLAYIMAFTGDMPQQNKNSGFKEQSAKKGCRSCLITADNRGDLDFDIIHNGRFHHHILQLRALSSTYPIGKFKAFCAEWGFAEKQS